MGAAASVSMWPPRATILPLWLSVPPCRSKPRNHMCSISKNWDITSSSADMWYVCCQHYWSAPHCYTRRKRRRGDASEDKGTNSRCTVMEAAWCHWVIVCWSIISAVQCSRVWQSAQKLISECFLMRLFHNAAWREFMIANYYQPRSSGSVCVVCNFGSLGFVVEGDPTVHGMHLNQSGAGGE